MSEALLAFSKLVSLPWGFAFIFFVWGMGILTGIIIGRSLKTTPIERERDAARDDLESLRRSIELVQRVS